MPNVKVTIRKRIKVTAKIRRGTGGSIPIITEIDGGTAEGIFAPINGLLDGGNA